MRVNTAFNRLLRLPGASVSDVSITHDAVEVTVRLRGRRLQCPCGHSTPSTYDRARRRWRHLDLGTRKLWLVYDIRRLDCPTCGVRTEDVPWARPTARHTRDFEDTVLWLARCTDRTSVATFMRCAWQTVTAIINRTVGEHLHGRRFDTLYRIGVDEICYRHPHKYLTVIGDHDTGKVVHIADGRGRESFTQFFELQSESERARIEAVSMDAAPAFRKTVEMFVPQARRCVDPFHVQQWVSRAMDQVFSAALSTRRTLTMQAPQWRKARVALRTGQNRLTDTQRDLLEQVTAADTQLGAAWRLKEQLRDLQRTTEPEVVAARLNDWIEEARTSKIPPFVQLARAIATQADGIVAATELGISNGLIEGINSKIRLINARGYGHHSAETLKSMIYLNLGGLEVKLPTQT